MNLRKVGDYNIGLDIGTASVGWAATDASGRLLHFNGKPTWGSRLFSEASKASEARTHRGQRRRYHRRRWRLDLLQELFQDTMQEVDSDFFTRMRQSQLWAEDRSEDCMDYHWPFFNSSDFTEKDYYAQFPTIYHLRKWLMETDKKADIRLIYLAFHNIVKYRGNFLRQDNESLSSANANVGDSIREMCTQLEEWCNLRGIDCTAAEHEDELIAVLSNTSRNRSTLRQEIASLLNLVPTNECGFDKKQLATISKVIAGAVVGLKTKLETVFFIDGEAPEGAVTNIYLSNDEQVEAFDSICPDDGRLLFESMKRVYSAFVLQEILSTRPGESLSCNKVAEYERYGVDLKVLKHLTREFVPLKYDEFFRGPILQGAHRYNTAEAKGYTLYNASHKTSYDNFRKSVVKLFEGTPAIHDARYIQMMANFERGRFLRRLKTSDNGSIPYQLHLEEMCVIIDRQEKFYPFLGQDKKKLCSLVSFRIPYYVGPLTQKNARKVNDNPEGELRFAWSVRREGKEDEKIYPWNWEEIIDKDESAERFIRRMTGTCTYLQGEPVLPKSSLLYEEFCVLNELNGAHFTQDGDREHRFDYADRAAILDDLFKKGHAVSYKRVADWMERHPGHGRVQVSGGQGERGFESKMSSYGFFCNKIFEVEELPESYIPMVEEIILWNTVFEDRDILQAKLKAKYGDMLSAEQIGKICRKRFAGWGRLSQKFLTGIKVSTDNGPMSIMDVLREGNPNNGTRSRAMVLMEVLRDENLGFEKRIDELNQEKLGDGLLTAIDDLPGSPALRRSIRQALGIVEEVARVAGHAPANIFIEVTRSDGKKGERTSRRHKVLKEALDTFKKDNPDWWDDEVGRNFNSISHGDLDEKLTLYFMQNGKSLYSGKPLEFGRLSEYQIDHILPQSYIKDDSLDNKALVLQEENQEKSDQMLLSTTIRRRMTPYWEALQSANLMSDKKFRNLTRDSVSEKQMKGFINRQLVETSQVVKLVQELLRERYSETDVRAIKAGLSSDLRAAAGLVKCREANDFHHAHDALLACEIGRFIQIRFPDMFDRPLVYAHAMKSFVRHESENVRRGRMPGGSSFVVSSFMRSGFDAETGEINQDTWNAAEELGRLRTYFNYRQCYISRMPEETSGAFWDATIYSPRDPKKKEQLKLPLKKDLDPKKYGSYSREQFAYFFIYRAMKGERQILDFAPVPVSVASELTQDAAALARYAAVLAEARGMRFCEIVRSKVYKYQLIEVEGSRLYITGQKEVRNAAEVALNQSETAIADSIAKGLPLDKQELSELFARIKFSLEVYSPRLAKALKIGEWDDRFFEASAGDEGEVLLSLLSIASAKTNMISLSAVGGGKLVGCMQPTFSKLFTAGDVFLIDQSITGMFERRETIGL